MINSINDTESEEVQDSFDPSQVVLPQWLSESLPVTNSPYVVDYKVEKSTYVVIHPDNYVLQEFNDLGEAFRYAETLDRNNDSSGGIKITDNIPEINHPLDRLSLSAKTEDGLMMDVIFSVSDEERLNSLKYLYGSWLYNIASYYEKNPDDFYAAYNFVDNHPFMWVKSEYDRDGYSWVTSEHAKRLWHHVSLSKEGKVVFSMEAGAHVPPAYDQYYRDFRLDVYASTYEEAIIKTAKLIHKFFNIDGSERENIQYEKSALELELEKRVEDYNNVNKEQNNTY